MLIEQGFDADPAADRALVDCASAALLPPWTLTHNEQRILFGRSLLCTQLEDPPCELTPFQALRARAWHARVGSQLPLETRLRLCHAYASTGDFCPDAADRLGRIAERSGSLEKARVKALHVFARAYPRDARIGMLLAARGAEPHLDILLAFEMEAQRIAR